MNENCNSDKSLLLKVVEWLKARLLAYFKVVEGLTARLLAYLKVMKGLKARLLVYLQPLQKSCRTQRT